MSGRSGGYAAGDSTVEPQEGDKVMKVRFELGANGDLILLVR